MNRRGFFALITAAFVAPKLPSPTRHFAINSSKLALSDIYTVAIIPGPLYECGRGLFNPRADIAGQYNRALREMVHHPPSW